MTRYSFFHILLTALIVFTCAACTPNSTVPLLYPQKDSSILPITGAPSVAVVQFKDNRSTDDLGVRLDNTSFDSTTPVTEWISRSLADALSREGLQVSYAVSTEQARNAGPTYIVTGEVNETWLDEQSHTTMVANIQIDVVLSNKKGRVLKEGFSASQSLSGLPSTSSAQTLLLDTVQKLVKPAATKLAQSILQK